MLAPSATHETASGSPAAAILGGQGTKGKKASGIAGLFSEILSQAQKGLGIKGAEAGKSALPTKEAGRSLPQNSAAQRVSLKLDEKTSGHRPKIEIAPPAADKLHARALAETSEQLGARKAKDKRRADRTEASAEAEAKAKKPADEKRRIKPSKEIEEDPANASRAALAAAKSTTTAAAAKGRLSQESNEAEGGVAEATKKRDGAKTEPKLSFLDLRRSVEARREASKVEGSAKAEDPAKDAVREIKSPGAGDRALVRELSLDARPAADASTWKADSGPAPGRGADFQSLLAERMREAWNGEIVKSAHIVLRDGDAGTIRLRLRPESLGNVKVELNLSDNNISGRILVESDEAKTAFERNMNQLADAFMQGGFDSAKLEVAVGGGSGGDSARGGAGDASGPFYSERLRSAVGSTAEPSTAVSAYARRGGAVDILA